MLVVCFIDCLLKVLGTEGKLPVKIGKGHEMQPLGVGNAALTTMCGSPVGYMQLKFNFINFGTLGNVNDCRGSWVYAVLCGIIFFHHDRAFQRASTLILRHSSILCWCRLCGREFVEF